MWRFESVEPGQIGASLTGFVAVGSVVSVEGVRVGTQNEGRADLLDSDCTTSSVVMPEKGARHGICR